MKIDREVQELINQVRAAGWSATFTSNNSRILFRSPTGSIVTCPVVCKQNLLRGIVRDLAKHGLDVGRGIPPSTSVRSAWEEAIARRERKLTPKECGEDREPAEVIIRNPTGSGKGGISVPTTSTITTTTTITTGGEVANPNAGETFKHTSISDAVAAGVNVSQRTKDAFHNDLTCKSCGQTLATLGACGRHLQICKGKDNKPMDVNKALEVITEALTRPSNTEEVVDLKRRLKMVKEAMNKDIMGMATQIAKALDGLDL